MHGVTDMIYLDKAATTLQKPPGTIQAVTEAMCSLGNAGRGAHEATLGAARVVFEARRVLADFFHAPSPKQIAFTANATESLNTAIKGILEPGDHVITTALEHNSVLRPLYEMEKRGVAVTVVPGDSRGRVRLLDFEQAVRPNTRAIICTHASNVTGNVTDILKIGETARAHRILFCVDASQTAGVIPVDVQKMNIDILCFTGHKSLLGPQGTGGIYVREGVSVRPLKSGGSGVQSYRKEHPPQMPAALEAGTLNGHGIAGLRASVSYIQETGIDAIREKELRLMNRFREGIQHIPGIRIYGDFDAKLRCPIVSWNLGDYDSASVSDELFYHYGIAVRPGAHCAPLMHQALGTAEQGTVRCSFSHFNTDEEIDAAVAAVREMAET